MCDRRFLAECIMPADVVPWLAAVGRHRVACHCCCVAIYASRAS
ncbi:hypothetical protein [Thermosporothrix hazakensis]|nr:hypothetical protein [Thermosporothrix hazakensis]